jgi:hypothetical protein
LIVLVLCVALASSVRAQSGDARVVAGIVRDSTGAVLVRATVVITTINGSNPVTTTTDARGRFTFRGLTRDSYRISASAAGFAELTRTIQVRGSETTTVEFVLRPAIAERVEVTSQGLSATTGLNSMTLAGPTLEALPDDVGSLLQRVRELAGATDTLGQVEVTVDGFRQLLWIPPKQAIQAIRISSNSFSPEFAQPGQPRVDIITKPGTDRTRGDFAANFSNEALSARNALATQDPAGQLREVTGYVSGPIVPQRWTFAVYGGRWRQQQDTVINATVLDASYTPTTRVETVATPSRVDNLWLGTSLQVGTQHTLAVSFSRTTTKAGNLGLESGLDLPTRSYNRTTSIDGVRGTLTSVPSPRAFNELRVQVGPERSTIQAVSAAPAVVVFDAFSDGGNQNNLLSATYHREMLVTDAVTVSVPQHTLKFGIDARLTDRQYTDLTNAGGTFLFGSDFERNAAGVPLQTVIAPLERYRRTLLGVTGYGPSQFFMKRGDPDVRFRDDAAGVFAQDDWSPTSRLSLSYGVRTEWQTVASEPRIGLRFGMAMALDDARKNVLRVGAGTFYQRIEPELTLDVTRLDGQHQEQVQIDQPPFFPAIPPNLEALPASLSTIYVQDSELRAPRIFMGATVFERQLTPGTFLTTKYNFHDGVDLLRTRNINAPGPAGVRPDPSLGQVLQYESTGRLRRHEASAGWRWNGSRGMVFVNYIYVHARSDTDGRTTVPADGSRLDLEYGPTATDREHSATAGGHLTVGGGLMISPYLTTAASRVFNLTTGFDNNGDGLFADRPAIVAANTPGAIQTPYGWLLADRPADAMMVTRNAGREPFMLRLDLRVSRMFRISPNAALALAANIENVLNRANFEGVNGVVTSSSFGTANRAGGPRRLYAAAGFSF